MNPVGPYAEDSQPPVLATRLKAEWDRVALLCRCLLELRKGNEPDERLKAAVADAQQSVFALRNEGWWKQFTEDHGLSLLDVEVAVFCASPAFDPQVGWMVHALQSGQNSVWPCAALIGELLFLASDEMPMLHDRLDAAAPLRSHGFIVGGLGHMYEPLQLSAAFLDQLRRVEASTLIPAIPGASLIRKSGRLDDLVVNKNCRHVLKEFIYFEQHRNTVQQEWGGRMFGGPVALFSGPSGTGKTFAATVLANELGYPLFRVDLGMLVSKYIGETEKNLSALFDAASGRKAVLLFDEADSLFGKRGEVRDARDRYANMEVSHLLSRMENHQGPCILTTNLRRHLDPAFARRFQMCAEFPRPDAVSRETLWKKAMPSKAPISSEVDWAVLGEELVLTGAQIQNIAIHASCCAAGDEEAIGLAHIARAVYVELMKEGKEVIPSTLGHLEGFLK